jgi:hypothetical protein
MSYQMPKYRPLYLIQRLYMRNKDNQIPFDERFACEYMGAAEFEQGELAKRIRELDANCLVGEIMVNGMFMLAAWNSERFTQQDVEREINRVYRGEQRTKEWTNFDDASRKSRKQKEAEGREPTNAWFDITNGLFWTWERCNISDVRKNFRLQVLKMDGQYTPRPKPPVPPKPLHPLRQRMLDEGRLRPAKES